MLIGVGRPNLSRGLIDDVRDALEGALWYLRLEGGRYRFTTEPNLNKVVLEREGAIGDDRIEALMREAISRVAPNTPLLKIEHRVMSSGDLPDNAELTLGILDFTWRFAGDTSDETLKIASEILEHRGGSWRSNKNAAMLVAADGPAIAKARSSARTLAPLRDLAADRHRLNRFNAEQREQLTKRLAAAEDRVPQQIAMAYRHLFLLGESDEGGTKLDHIDLGPARVDTQIGERVLEYLRSADRLVETTLAPAALLATRFGLLPEGTDAVELDTLLGYFSRLPRLPKLAGAQVLRQALVDGVAKGLFGLASGSSWEAGDAVLRFDQPIDPSEVQFQPGTWLVRASTIKDLIAKRPSAPPEPKPPTAPGEGEERVKRPPEPPPPTPGTALSKVRIRIGGIPASKARDVVKVAVLPLSASASEVTLQLSIGADGGLGGIPRETLNLVVLEGLRQLGLDDVDVSIDDNAR
jgi:uncharacterized protein